MGSTLWSGFFLFLKVMEGQFEINLGKIYLLYYKAKISLGESHLMQNPKNYMEKFELEMPFQCDIDILNYLVARRTPTYSTLSKKCWILFVLEITKILSYKEAYGIGKLYNQIVNKNIKMDLNLDSFKPVLELINDKNKTSTVSKLKFLRNKHYAHTDADVEHLTESLFPTYDEVWIMMFSIELFLRDVYAQQDSDIDLAINRNFSGYLREFRRTYEYFKTINDPVEKMILQRHFGEEKIQLYFNL